MFANDIKLNVERLAFKCHNQGIYAVESETEERMVYICDNGELAIARNNGLLRLDVKDVPMLIEELKGIYEDYTYRENGQLQLKATARIRHFGEEKDARYNIILEMLKAGAKGKEIAAHLGMSQQFVSNKKKEFERAGLL